MKKLKQSQYYGIGLLVLMLVVFWAVFKVLAPTTFGSPQLADVASTLSA